MQTENVIAEVTGIDGRSEETVLEDIGQPQLRPIRKYSGERHEDPSAPQYLVMPVDWTHMQGNNIKITEKAFLMDFGSAFAISEPPKSMETSLLYSAPEWILEKKFGIGSDIWGLGCVLYEIRTGVNIFQGYSSEEDYLSRLCKILGKMPEPWWSKTWQTRRKQFEDETDNNGRVVVVEQMRNGIADKGVRSIREAIETVFQDIDLDFGGSVPKKFEKKEVDLFSDLLGKIFQWKPEDRITAKQIMDHDWFKL